MRLHLGTGAIISWEPDDSLQVMREIHLLQNLSGNSWAEIIIHQNTPVAGTIQQ
jgi:hypothetical protein